MRRMSFFLHKNKEILAEYGTMQGTWSSVFCKELIDSLSPKCLAENIILHKYKKKWQTYVWGHFKSFWKVCSNPLYILGMCFITIGY